MAIGSRRGAGVAWLVALGALLAWPAAAQQPVGAPALGVDPSPRRGIFAETTLGLFTTLGGSRAFSNGQPFLGLTVGRDLGEVASLFLSIGIGASSNSCFDPVDAGCAVAADSFGATFVEAGFSYGRELASRLRLSGRLVAGLTQLSPGPILDRTSTTGGAVVPDTQLGPHGGLGLGLDYDTRLDHFAVGLDLLGRYSLVSKPGGGALGLSSLAVLPRVRYVF
jgi:hypothetical protein